MRTFLQMAVGVALMAPGIASADVYNWTFGGGTDPVSGSGTLTAVATTYANIDIITGGMGTITYGGNTYSVAILPLTNPGSQFSSVNYGVFGNVCGSASSPSLPCATLQNPPLSGGANYTFDNALYLNALPASSELDANGIVFYNQAGPQSQQYFNLWSAASNYNPLPDNFWATDSGDGWNNYNVNLSNPFTVSETYTPEPSFYGLLALGLGGLVTVAARRRTSRT